MFHQRTPKSAMILVIVTLTLFLLACNLSALISEEPTVTPQPPRIITNAVMTSDVKSGSFEPVDVKTLFPADQNIFHAVVTVKDAPDQTAVKAVWFDDSGTQIGEYELETNGSRNLDFSFKPNTGKLPAGNYKVEVYLNGELDRTLNFSVAAAPAQAPTAPKPTSVTQSTSSSPKPSGYVNEVVIAEGTQGSNKEPVNPTVVYSPTSVFHAVVRTQNAPANTKFKALWYAVNVGSAAAPNSLIKETEVTTDGSRNIDFSLSPAAGWPVGTYRVEIAVNDVVDTIKTFSVK